MYLENLNELTKVLESKDINLAGGATVGIILTIVNSLIIYTGNLTVGKEKYKLYESEIKQILEAANDLKMEMMLAVEKDKCILDELLKAYKNRKQDKNSYQQICRESVEFCLEVARKSM